MEYASKSLCQTSYSNLEGLTKIRKNKPEPEMGQVQIDTIESWGKEAAARTMNGGKAGRSDNRSEVEANQGGKENSSRERSTSKLY